MLTSFEVISVYAVLSGCSGLAIGSRVFPSARALDKAWDDGRRRGRREADRAAWRDGYEQGADDEARSYAPCEGGHDDARTGTRGLDAADDPQAQVLEVPDPDLGPVPPGPDDRPGDRPGLDWADELSGIRTQIITDDAAEVLAAQPPPAPGTFEYYASERQQEFDHWLAGVQAELAAEKRELERSTA